MSNKFNVAIVGATGLVGEAFLEILAERNFPIDNLYLLASERSAGQEINFLGKPYTIQNLDDFDFTGVHFAFFSAGSKVSAEYAPFAAEQGCTVIDNTSHFRYEAGIPLIVPEVNGECLENYQTYNIIANPNCSTIQMLVALKPIYDAVGISRINVATYQSVSGAGRSAIDELARQTANLLSGEDIEINVFPKPIAFNVIPQIGDFQDNGYSYEEMKMVWETRKIFQDETILVNPTTVRVPVFYGHSEVINIETKRPISADEAKVLLQEAPGIVLLEDSDYPTAMTDAAGQDGVFVGRIRNDLSNPLGLNLWVVSDNVRKGAALNAIQIAELLINDFN